MVSNPSESTISFKGSRDPNFRCFQATVPSTWGTKVKSSRSGSSCRHTHVSADNDVLAAMLNTSTSNRTIISPSCVYRLEALKHNNENERFDHALLAVDTKPVQDTKTKVVLT